MVSRNFQLQCVSKWDSIKYTIEIEKQNQWLQDNVDNGFLLQIEYVIP